MVLQKLFPGNSGRQPLKNLNSGGEPMLVSNKSKETWNGMEMENTTPLKENFLERVFHIALYAKNIILFILYVYFRWRFLLDLAIKGLCCFTRFYITGKIQHEHWLISTYIREKENTDLKETIRRHESGISRIKLVVFTYFYL